MFEQPIQLPFRCFQEMGNAGLITAAAETLCGQALIERGSIGQNLYQLRPRFAVAAQAYDVQGHLSHALIGIGERDPYRRITLGLLNTRQRP